MCVCVLALIYLSTRSYLYGCVGAHFTVCALFKGPRSFPGQVLADSDALGAHYCFTTLNTPSHTPWPAPHTGHRRGARLYGRICSLRPPKHTLMCARRSEL